jgi:peptide chain release factor subunit 1
MEATMFSDKDLKALLDYSSEGRVLSVYLNTDPTQVQAEAAKIQLRNLLKTVDLPEDVQAVEQFINYEYDWAAKGVAIFTNQGENFFQSFQYGLPVPDKVFIGDKPIIRPLAHLLDNFTGWGVVLVDKQGARLFSFHMGDLVEIQGVLGDEVKQLKRGGGDAMFGRRGGSDPSGKVENIIERNIKEVIEHATAFFSHHHIRRIMIGGTDDNIARFKDELPKSWQSLVVSDFSMSMSAHHQEVLQQATQEAIAAQKRITQALVDQAVTLAAKGSNGVTGLIDALNAIHEGRVKTLLVLQDFEQAGYRCNGCGYLTVQELETCPFCGGSFDRIEHAVEMAVQETLKKNAEAKVILENETLAQAGHIAAILRY